MDSDQSTGPNNPVGGTEVNGPCPPMSGFVRGGPGDDVRKCPPVSADVRKCPDLSAHLKMCGTNPTARDRGLVPRQMAAARLIVKGVKPATVANLLLTTDRTIRRWQALPHFQAELRRLHDLMVAPVQASQPASAQRPPKKSRDIFNAPAVTLRERLEREYANKPFECF